MRDRIRVLIEVDDDEHATRIAMLLEALDYEVVRQLESRGSAVAWQINQIARRHKLTLRERELFEMVLEGLDNATICKRLEVSRATVKWHMHNVFAKTNTGNRESLVRLVTGLPPREQVEPEPEPIEQAEFEERFPATSARLRELGTG